MNDEKYMTIALEHAIKSIDSEDVPVGAVIVMNDKVISQSYNQKEKNKKATQHAESLAIEKASEILGTYRLDGATIYTTKEPCLMCMGAILSARISRIVYGASDKRFGTESLAKENNFNHTCVITGGILKEDCERLLSDFFKKLR